MTSALHTSALSLPLLARGKVRENYAVGDDRILMVSIFQHPLFPGTGTVPLGDNMDAAARQLNSILRAPTA